MIIGNNKNVVVNNIKNATENEEYNSKVEINDPSMTSSEKRELLDKYLANKDTISYKAKTEFARMIVGVATWMANKDTVIEGLENVKDIKNGAIITNNHFNPIDSTIVREFVKKMGKRKMFIVGEETNLAMDGMIGFIMNYADVIPISSNISYMKKEFSQIISEKLEKNNFILIYPEQEMWFNYRKPRPLKLGAYYFAVKNNVPIISCFTEIIDEQEQENEEFRKVKYKLHILKPIYPDPDKKLKENAREMMNKDFNQKKEAYEKAYNKKLNYEFEKDDIAGFIWKDEN